jgi:hypothetical protein
MVGMMKAALLTGLTSLALADIQITQPAPKATTLAIQPDPMLRWVYTSSDPDLVGFVVRQVKTDYNYQPMLILSRGATPVSLGSIAIPMGSVKWEEGMNVTIAITEITEESQNDPLDQKILVSRGPLRLVQGSNGIQPMGTHNESSAAATTPTATTALNSPAATATQPPISESSTTSRVSSAAAISNTDPGGSDAAARTNGSLPTAPSDTANAATATPSSHADKVDGITVLYVVTLIVTAIPAFLFGFSD